MANIDTDKHGLHVAHYFWELEVKKISADLAVDLPQNVAGLRGVERIGIPDGDHLGGNFVFLEQFFVHLVGALLEEDHHNKLWMSKDAAL